MATNTEPLNFPVTPELKARIQAYATDHAMSLSAACRVLLTRGLEREEKEA